jgi:hypothetical protein
MNLDHLRQKLIAAARTIPPDDRVPYAFERRVMARLAGRAIRDDWALWARGLWGAAAPCLTLCLLLVVWSLISPDAAPSTDFSQELENTVLVAADPGQTVDASW